MLQLQLFWFREGGCSKIYPRYGHDRLSFRTGRNDEVTPWGKFDLGKLLKTSLVKGQGDAGRRERTFQDVKQEFCYLLLTVGVQPGHDDHCRREIPFHRMSAFPCSCKWCWNSKENYAMFNVTKLILKSSMHKVFLRPNCCAILIPHPRASDNFYHHTHHLVFSC